MKMVCVIYVSIHCLGALLSLILKEAQEITDEEKSTQHKMPSTWDPRYELLDQLCLTSFATFSYMDINDGLFANLSVKHYLKDTVKNIQSKKLQYNSDILAGNFNNNIKNNKVEEPSCDALEMAIDPLKNQGNVNNDMMWIMLTSLEAVLKEIFGNDFIRGPLSVHDWLALCNILNPIFSHIASGSNPSLPNVEILPIPNVIVGFQDDWMKLSASKLDFLCVYLFL